MEDLRATIKAPLFWFTGLLVVMVGYGLWQTSDVIVLMLTAVVFAVFLESVVDLIPSRLRIPRMLSIILVFLLGLGIVVAVITAAIPVFIKEISVIKAFIPKGSGMEQFLSAFSTKGGGFSLGSHETITKLSSSIGSVTQNLFSVVGGTFGSLANTVLLSMLTLYLALEDRAIERLIRAVVPQKSEGYALSLWFRLRVKTEAWFRGQLIIAIIVAVATYVGLLVFGMPYAVLLSVLAGLLGLIPFGVVIAYIPAVGLAFAHGEVLTPLYITLLYGGIQYLTDYVVQPLYIRRITGLPPLLVIISLVIAVQLFGFLGFFLAIPAAILLLEVVSDLEKNKSPESTEILEQGEF